MSASKKHLSDPEIVRNAVRIYRETTKTQMEVARELGISHSTINEILKHNLTAEELRTLKAKRYRESKTGAKNPVLGKRPPNYIGDFDDGKGYKKRYVGEVQQFVHRVVVADAIGIDVGDLPSSLHVHHIDGNKHNNDINNLALVTPAAHKKFH